MTVKYNPVTESVIERLVQIVGENYVIHGDSEKLFPYSHDEIPDQNYASMPEVVVRPDKTCQIAEIMKLANSEKIPVTPRGAGSGLSGGAVPIHGGIVLSCDRMNRILEIDEKNMMAVVEPGVITASINEKLQGTGLFYAGYPMSLETCFIAGNVAENAGGGKAVKYGVTSRYVLGLEVVTPTGEIIELGGKLIKDVTGYNLIQLMLGSEGTLGIFTKITLRLLPQPEASVDLLVLFDSLAAALDTIPSIFTRGRIVPAAIEFMDSNCVRQSCQYLNETLPWEQCRAMLIITVDGNDEATVTQEYDKIGQICLDHGASEVFVADNPTTSERIWNVRKNIPEAYSLISNQQANEDLVVPPAAIGDLVEGMQQLQEKYDLQFPAYGHAGDGNLHVRIIKNPNWTDEQWLQTIPGALEELYRLTASLGGRLSGEHGIGHKRKNSLHHFVSEEYINLLRAIKSAFDPGSILNPGKIFDH